MAWIYLLLGGFFEIGWPLGFKLAHDSSGKILWIAFSVLSMALSGLFLFMAQKTIPIGTAYVVWTGIGAVGTLLIGIFFFNEFGFILEIIFSVSCSYRNNRYKISFLIEGFGIIDSTEINQLRTRCVVRIGACSGS